MNLKSEPMANKLYNILVPVDFTGKNKYAITKGIEVANQMNCNIHLVNIVSPPLFSSFSPYESHVDRMKSYDQLKDLAISYSHQLRSHGKIEISVLEGNATNNLVDYIKEFEMDLVLIGLSKFNLVQRWVATASIKNLATKTNVPVLAVDPTGVVPMPGWWNRLTNKLISYDSRIPVITMDKQ
jgi:nucleotide-binding universal stress UspA family protein